MCQPINKQLNNTPKAQAKKPGDSGYQNAAEEKDPADETICSAEFAEGCI